jgi:hypothetical protein
MIYLKLINKINGKSNKVNNMTKNKLNTLFNDIGNNAVNNENTSLDIIKEYLNLHNDNKLKVNNTGIYLLLKTKNNAGIKATIKGIEKLNEITDLRKTVVNKLILPMANFSNLVESENETETKVEKNKKKKEKQANVESEYAVNKSNESIKNNTIRTTANNITIPLLFLISQDKGNYDFDNGKLYINIKAIEKNVVQSVFGFNKDNIKSDGKYFVAVNLTMLIKLSKADLFSVKITASENNKTENENVDVATTEAVEGEFTESKNKQITQSVITFLNYLDKNKAFNSLLEIENHIFTLDNYGHKKNAITENVRAQTKGSKNYDLYGSVAVEFNHSKDFEVNSIDQLENEFNKVFAIK